MIRDQQSANFRPDINGLRAIAVIGVVAFHFKFGPLRAGGFAGVDVFFVISGFLMTQIITGRLDQARFSLRDFLLARVARIVPAFVALIGIVLLAGLVLLNPLIYEALAERAIWSLLFSSNVLFAKQGVYFVAPEQNWLLHTWSLSVEAQFYLLFPLLLVVSRKLTARRSVEIGVILAIAFVSFAVMIWSLSAGGDTPSWSFYMLWSRAWEFLAGGLCAYAMRRTTAIGSRARITLHYLGLAGILLAMLIFHNTTPWPGPATALPVAGAVAILLADHREPAWARIAPTRLLGTWSYSVYLWHWPVAAALSFFGYGTLPFRLAGIAASLLLGWASFNLVERRTGLALLRKRWRVGLATYLAAVAFATIATETNGLETARFAFRPAILANLKDLRRAHKDLEEGPACDKAVWMTSVLQTCKFGNLDAQDVLVIGDSFAGEITPRYKGVFAGAPFGITFLSRYGCAPFTGAETIVFGSGCDVWADAVYHFARETRFKRVVFIFYWPFYVQGRLCFLNVPDCGTELDPALYAARLDQAYARLAGLWRALAAQGKDVKVFGLVPIPPASQNPMALYQDLANGARLDDRSFSLAAFEAENTETGRRLAHAAAQANVELIDPAPSLCPNGRCPIMIGGKAVYADFTHFRASMVKDARFAIYDRYIIPHASVGSGTRGRDDAGR